MQPVDQPLTVKNLLCVSGHVTSVYCCKLLLLLLLLLLLERVSLTANLFYTG
jgi:hypothetical protein